MQRLEATRKAWTRPDGSSEGVLDISVSTRTELPSIGDFVGGIHVMQGSIANIIQTGEFVTLDENGTWYPEESPEPTPTPTPTPEPTPEPEPEPEPEPGEGGDGEPES